MLWSGCPSVGETYTQSFVIRPDSELSPGENAYPQSVYAKPAAAAVETAAVWGCVTSGDNQGLEKSLKGRPGEWDVFRGIWKALTDSWEIWKASVHALPSGEYQ